MQVRIIRSDEDLTKALKQIDALWNAEPGTAAGDKLDALVALVTAYEDKHHPVRPADPIDVLHFSMEQNGRTQADLAALLGSRSRASEILNRRRALTLDHIRLISRAWRIPAGALVGVETVAA
jgi:HTH-type transcriptional regulator/antitoxin HigA